MEQALHYQDAKSNKFWRVETEGCFMLVNWGKVGANGRWQISEYDSEEECEQAAAKLLATKQKKGYQPMPEFDPSKQVYFDTEEYGPHPLTSHPVFRQYFTDDIYYDCGDEEAPFGSDEGSDTLFFLQECYRPNLNYADFPRKMIEEAWGLTWLPPSDSQTDEELLAQAAQPVHGLPGEQEILQSDQVVLAVALGQIKISGRLDKQLLQLAERSLRRWERMYRLLWQWQQQEPPYNIAIMRRDLQKFAEEQCN